MKTIFLTLYLSIISSDIIMRHDVDDAKYLELGAKYGGSAVRLNAGCGTFIRPNWIITAAHVASSRRIGDDVTVNGVKYVIQRKIIHPGFSMTRSVLNDIALLQLTENVPNVELAKLYQKTDEVGKEIIFAGTGWAGTGDKGMTDGAINKDRKLRAAQNLIDGSKTGYIRFTFDAPETENSLPLEGISGPGDSGGPALWFDGDQAYIMGVSSHQDGRGTGKPEGVYGVYEYYTRVSEFSDWVLGEMEEKY
ncbi:MAG: trypsin-like serine protease [Cyclobacteriaceae bacterium]